MRCLHPESNCQFQHVINDVKMCWRNENGCAKNEPEKEREKIAVVNINGQLVIIITKENGEKRIRPVFNNR